MPNCPVRVVPCRKTASPRFAQTLCRAQAEADGRAETDVRQKPRCLHQACLLLFSPSTLESRMSGMNGQRPTWSPEKD
jgi:hypothetical protein